MFVNVRSSFDRILWIIEMFDLFAHPQSSIPYTLMGLIIVEYRMILFSNESIEILPISQL